MDFIYSRARKICICIPNPSLPVYWTEHGRLLRWPDYGRLIRWLRTGLPDTPEDVKETLFTDMQQLFSTRYFSRVWVVQEVALARVAYLIVNDEELLLTSTVLDRLSLLCAESRHFKLPGCSFELDATRNKIAYTRGLFNESQSSHRKRSSCNHRNSAESRHPIAC
jgi:hypothetical protein